MDLINQDPADHAKISEALKIDDGEEFLNAIIEKDTENQETALLAAIRNIDDGNTKDPKMKEVASLILDKLSKVDTKANKDTKRKMDQLLIGIGVGKEDKGLGVNKYGSSPLMWASRLGQSDLVEKLLERGADPTFQNGKESNALHWVAKYNPENLQKITELLIKACHKTSKEHAEVEVDEDENEPDDEDQGHREVVEKDNNCLKKLIDQKDSWNLTALERKINHFQIGPKIEEQKKSLNEILINSQTLGTDEGINLFRNLGTIGENQQGAQAVKEALKEILGQPQCSLKEEGKGAVNELLGNINKILLKHNSNGNPAPDRVPNPGKLPPNSPPRRAGNPNPEVVYEGKYLGDDPAWQIKDDKGQVIKRAFSKDCDYEKQLSDHPPIQYGNAITWNITYPLKYLSTAKPPHWNHKFKIGENNSFIDKNKNELFLKERLENIGKGIKAKLNEPGVEVILLQELFNPDVASFGFKENDDIDFINPKSEKNNKWQSEFGYAFKKGSCEQIEKTNAIECQNTCYVSVHPKYIDGSDKLCTGFSNNVAKIRKSSKCKGKSIHVLGDFNKSSKQLLENEECKKLFKPNGTAILKDKNNSFNACGGDNKNPTTQNENIDLAIEFPAESVSPAAHLAKLEGIDLSPPVIKISRKQLYREGRQSLDQVKEIPDEKKPIFRKLVDSLVEPSEDKESIELKRLEEFETKNGNVNISTKNLVALENDSLVFTDEWMDYGYQERDPLFDEKQYAHTFVDFANTRFGGGVFRTGNVQEEKMLQLSGDLAFLAAIFNPGRDPAKLFTRKGQNHKDRQFAKKDSADPLLITGVKFDLYQTDVDAKNSKNNFNITTYNKVDGDKVKPVNILAIAAPELKKGNPENQRGVLYSDMEVVVKDLFSNAYEGFRLVRQNDKANNKKSYVTTGRWGAGVFGHDIMMSFAVQYLAARLAGIEKIEFSGFDKDLESNAGSLKQGIDIELSLIPKGTTTVDVFAILNKVIKGLQTKP